MTGIIGGNGANPKIPMMFPGARLAIDLAIFAGPPRDDLADPSHAGRPA
jgi:hypothetical protein